MERSDAELLEASIRGERQAFGALIERYQGVVSAVSYSRTRDRALGEDVAQDTFIAAWRQLDQLREPSRLRGWLCGIAKNLARKARRRADREAIATDDAWDFGDARNPFDRACEAETERLVRDALAHVPERYRDALVLYYREQRSVREVARLLEITEATALQRLARGRKYLAAGVTDLVERSLGGHVQKSLVLAVLAALPTLAPSRVSAATHTSGGTMLKFALATAAVAATGTTVYIVHSPAAPAQAAATQIAPTVAGARAVAAPAAPTLAPTSPRPATSPPTLSAISRDAMPILDDAAIAHAHLTQGPSRGPANAPVTITLFTDLTCTHCGNALGTIDQLFDDYPNKLRLVVKQLPVHKQLDELPAEAAFAADAQGKFWPMFDLMFAHQDDLSRDAVLELAQQAGLDVAVVRTALDSHTYAAAVATDAAEAKDIELNATPSFVINGRRVIGNWPVAELHAVIDDALAHPNG